MNFQRCMIPFWKHQELGGLHWQVPGVNQSVTIQLASAEDGEGFLQDIWIKNISVVG